MWLGPTFLDLLILTSDFCTCGTFVSLALNLTRSKSGAGLSLQSLGTVVGARCLHLLSHFLRLHYIPAILPWLLYASMDVLNAIAGITLLGTFALRFFSTYEREKDDFGIHVFEKLDALPKAGPLRKSPAIAVTFLYMCIVVLALLWYCVRRSSHSFAISYFCCFYEVMGAVALIPQLWMFQKDKRVSPLLANFVVLTAMNRLCTLVFWIAYPRVYVWRYPDNRGIQMASEMLNLLILSDFLFYWVRSKMRGDTEIILGEPDV
mmetsp:Transcript_130681/g.378055  ORF Transcript_130681/g.378055 Transcript_130681/m.378055 type:complete len:263 (-) Transcript_130681:46-834(-)